MDKIYSTREAAAWFLDHSSGSVLAVHPDGREKELMNLHTRLQGFIIELRAKFPDALLNFDGGYVLGKRSQVEQDAIRRTEERIAAEVERRKIRFAPAVSAHQVNAMLDTLLASLPPSLTQNNLNHENIPTISSR